MSINLSMGQLMVKRMIEQCEDSLCKTPVSICTECQYVGDKFSFPMPNDLAEASADSPMFKCHYCCCGDSPLYGKLISTLNIKCCEHFEEL